MAKVTDDDIARAAELPLKYFSHDSHMAESMACRRLVRRCGPDGYGRYMRLLELLASEHGHVLDFTDKESQYLVAERLWLGEDLAALGQFLNDLAECGLIQRPGDGAIKSSVVDETALYFGKRRAIGATGGRPRKGDAKNV